jgi:hypothetical protein
MKTKANWDWKPYHMSAERVKELVSSWAWACGMWSIEEIGSVCDGRLDMLLVPLNMASPVFKSLSGHWTERLGLVGVEVKVDKGDFKSGLDTKQFDRYADGLSGLYIAGPPDVVERKLIPEQYGVIHVGGKRLGNGAPQPIACRRHARFTRRPLSEEQHWRIIWAMAKSIGKFTREERERTEKLEMAIRKKAGDAIWAAVKKAAEV